VWNVEWKTVWTGLIGLVLGGALTWLARTFLEMRRRIRFSVPSLYFGPALDHNNFMGRNYPSEDMLGLDCELRFFSEKAEVIGLHDFHIEFCQETIFVLRVHFRPDMDHVVRDINNKETPYRLDALELPPKKFVSVTLMAHLERKDWPQICACNVVQLSCKTSSGQKRRFTIGHIKMPEMPPEGVRGLPYMSVQVMPKELSNDFKPSVGFVILAARRRNPPRMNLLDLPAEDARYWSGDGWVASKTEAKNYRTLQDARSAGELAKIWNVVPEEWLVVEE
jgi:hypothetical protein